MRNKLNSKIIFSGRCIKPTKTIILIPNDHITINNGLLKSMSKYQAKLTIVSSIKTNQSPRFKRKLDNSDLDFLLPTINAEVPAKKQNVGAQKCVINRVKKMGNVL